jgi:hypothetical protein
MYDIFAIFIPRSSTCVKHDYIFSTYKHLLGTENSSPNTAVYIFDFHFFGRPDENHVWSKRS